jgi:hypothetical protein
MSEDAPAGTASVGGEIVSSLGIAVSVLAGVAVSARTVTGGNVGCGADVSVGAMIGGDVNVGCGVDVDWGVEAV